MKFAPAASERGSALITVIGFCAILLILVASVLKYAGFERRLNNREKLHFEARLAAEGISEFGIAQVKNVLESNRTFTDSTWTSTDESLFVPTGSYAGTINLPPDAFWGGGHVVPSTDTDTTKVPLMHVGKILDISGGGLHFIDPTNPDNDSDPMKGKRVFKYSLDILSRATAKDQFGSITNYMQQTFAIRAAPLFSNAVYYNMDLEVQPGPNMTVTGSTHTNGRLFARSASASPNYITFAGPVTAVRGFWTNFNGSSGVNTMPFFQSYNESGALQTNATTGLVQILPAGSSTAKGLRLTANTTGYSPNLTSGTWVESTWNLNPAGETWQQHLGDASPKTETNASKENFANWIQQTFRGNLLTNVNGIQPTNLQGIPDYVYSYGSLYPDPNTGTSDAAYTYLSGGNDVNNSAHALIESPRLTSAASYYKPTEDIKYSRNAGLYIVVNTTAANAVGHKPDGTPINVKAQSYRAFMNNTNTSPYTVSEVILPGQDTYGDNNTSNNTWTSHKNARPIVTIFNIDYNTASGTYNQEKATRRQMYDLRRTLGGDPGNDSNTTFSHVPNTRSATNVYVPKLIDMIDVDLTELKKSLRALNVAAVGTTYTTAAEFYSTGLPSTNFTNYIYKSGNPAMIAATVNDNNWIITTDMTTKTKAFTTSIWNGAVYVESIAADSFDTTGGTAAIRRAKTIEKRNSGVRLINGRGKAPSSNSTQGFSLITNDVVYVLGTFNADGDSTTPSTVSVDTPPSPGASTGHNYETGELPVSIVADAIYLLSQPSYSSETTQANGWNDALAQHRKATTNWISTWATTNPSNINLHDGIDTATNAYTIPYDSASGSSAVSRNSKFTPVFSEYSFAMLCGIVPTGKNGVNQTSGGLHNFPRFLEAWGGVECRIRGSFVALFECRVGQEPWNLRVYSPPTRVWGFNLLFDEGLMPPLTPKTLSFRRSGAVDITKAQYNSKLSAWGYTVLP